MWQFADAHPVTFLACFIATAIVLGMLIKRMP